MNLHSLSLPEWLVLGFGFAGQALFSARFLIQWIASERERKSVVPVLFWYFSLAGGVVLLRTAAADTLAWSERPVLRRAVAATLGRYRFTWLNAGGP